MRGVSNNRVHLLIFIVLLLIGGVMSNCTPENRYSILTFFFDGVPDPNDSLLVMDSVSVLDSIETPQTTADNFYFHKPFLDKDCDNCHKPGSFGALLLKEPDLCYKCHVPFSAKYTSLHGPVLSGYCTECHNPHKSKLKYLINVQGDNLCDKCHDVEIIKLSTVHSNTDDRSCYHCHNPHGGDNPAYIRKGICYSCHDDFTLKYEYLHGPVLAEYCSMCHQSHLSGSDHNLLREGQALCYYCHLESYVLNNSSHQDIGMTDCINCHNPHGSSDKALLY